MYSAVHPMQFYSNVANLCLQENKLNQQAAQNQISQMNMQQRQRTAIPQHMQFQPQQVRVQYPVQIKPVSGHQHIVPTIPLQHPPIQYLQQPPVLNTRSVDDTPAKMSVSTIEPTKDYVSKVYKYDGNKTENIPVDKLEYDEITGKLKPHAGYTFVQIQCMEPIDDATLYRKASQKLLNFTLNPKRDISDVSTAPKRNPPKNKQFERKTTPTAFLSVQRYPSNERGRRYPSNERGARNPSNERGGRSSNERGGRNPSNERRGRYPSNERGGKYKKNECVGNHCQKIEGQMKQRFFNEGIPNPKKCNDSVKGTQNIQKTSWASRLGSKRKVVPKILQRKTTNSATTKDDTDTKQLIKGKVESVRHKFKVSISL
jgi:hypothetical protein